MNDIKQILCEQGCLCCICKYQNKSINKKYNETVLCKQQNGKCIDIKSYNKICEKGNDNYE